MTFSALFMIRLVLAAPSAPIPAILKSGTPDEISAYIDATVESGKAPKGAVAGFIRLLGSDDANIKVRERSAWALGELREPSAVPALLKATEHKGLLIRSAAVDALAQIRPISALSALTRVAESDPIVPLRRRAVLALGLLQNDKVIPALVKFAADPNPEIRGSDALAMAANQSTKNDFSQALKQMTGDADPYVQERAQRGLDVALRKNVEVRKQLAVADSDIRLFAAIFFRANGTGDDIAAVNQAASGETDTAVRREEEISIKAIKARVAAADKARKQKEQRARAKKSAKTGAAKSGAKPSSNKPAAK